MGLEYLVVIRNMSVSMNFIWLIVSIGVYASLIDVSIEDCRVLADCDDGRAQWQNLVQGPRGRPGKRGVEGPVGSKGEPGIGVNITELKEYLEMGKKGPKLYYFAPTLTWQSSKTFCERFDRTLCTFDQICPQNNAGRQYIDDIIPGDHWVAVLDGHNDWAEIGDYHITPCVMHRPPKFSQLPPWGVSSGSAPHKGYVYCCKVSAATERVAPQIRYQYIGKAATYDMSAQHCELQGRKLCYSSDVCKTSQPVLGLVTGNKWIAVRDRHNEWIQIGNAEGSTCKTHGILHGLPSWGVRTDGSLQDQVGYVYCCRSSDGR